VLLVEFDPNQRMNPGGDPGPELPLDRLVAGGCTLSYQRRVDVQFMPATPRVLPPRERARSVGKGARVRRSWVMARSGLCSGVGGDRVLAAAVAVWWST
jgi:hypothetical protein